MGGGIILAGDTLSLTYTHSYTFHEDIPYDNRVMGYTRMKITPNKQNKNNQRAITLKRNNGKES